MSTQKNKLDDFFKNSFENAELKPADHSWNGLESKLLNQQSDKDRKKIFFLRWLLVASVLLSVSFGAIYFLNEPQKQILSDNSNLKLKNSVLLENKKEVLENKNILTKEEIIANDKQKQESHEQTQSLENNINSAINKEQPIINKTNLASNQTSKTINQSRVEEKTLVRPVRANGTKVTSNKKQKAANSKSNEQSTKSNTPNNVDEKKETETNNEVAKNKQEKSDIILKDTTGNYFKTKNNVAFNSIQTNDSILQNKSTDSVQNNTAEQNQIVSIPDPIKEIKDDSKKQNWYVEIMYSNDYAYQNYDNVSLDSNLLSIKKTYGKYTKPKYGYSYGINIGYIHKEKWSFQLGINYANKGEQTTASYAIDTFSTIPPQNSVTIFSPANNTSNVENNQTFSLYEIYSAYPNYNNVGIDSINVNQKINHNYEYMDVPFLIGYHFGKNKFRVYASVGASASFFYRYRTIQLNDRYNDRLVTQGDNSPFKKVYYSALINVGAEYRFNSKFSFNIEPTFRYGLTSIVKNMPVNGYLHSFGLVTGLRYHF